MVLIPVVVELPPLQRAHVENRTLVPPWRAVILFRPALRDCFPTSSDNVGVVRFTSEAKHLPFALSQASRTSAHYVPLFFSCSVAESAASDTVAGGFLAASPSAVSVRGPYCCSSQARKSATIRCSVAWLRWSASTR